MQEPPSDPATHLDRAFGSGYVAGQFARARRTAADHPDAETRARASSRAERWLGVLRKLWSGEIRVGSRTPVRDTPAWVTLEVVTGGFATTGKVAGGPLREHEQTLLARTGVSPDAGGEGDGGARHALNTWFVSAEGLQELLSMLRSGAFEVQVPEEAALLTLAALLERGADEEARALRDALAPHAHELRFYPVPAPPPAPELEPDPEHGVVHRRTVGDVRKALEAVRPTERLLAQRETLLVWLPLYDRMVDLFLETVEGETPDLCRGTDGTPLPTSNGRFPVVGGWPCARRPEGWTERAASLVAEVRASLARHRHSLRPRRREDAFARLLDALDRWGREPGSLDGRDVGRIRLVLARTIAKHGARGSAARADLRRRQAAQVAPPTHDEFAAVLSARLSRHPQGDGLGELAPILEPVQSSESAGRSLRPGLPIPDSLERKVQLCRAAPLDELLASGLVPSGDVLAELLPQVTANVLSASIADPDLRRLYARTYRAFRRRRSLLLLNLEGQVRLQELPWVAALDRLRGASGTAEDAARETLRRTAALALRSFPHAIVPNKLRTEFRALADTAGIRLPLVGEIAADIFTGRFQPVFVEAAHAAGRLLRGTLYETYYDVDFAGLLALRKSASGTRNFEALCRTRAGVAGPVGSPAENGQILEQQQILTTQNLAALFEALELREPLAAHLPDLARASFDWLAARLARQPDGWHAQLVSVKNAAYAWRQMLFFASLVEPAERSEFVAWTEGRLANAPPRARARLAPAIAGLRRAMQGESPESGDGSARRFLGWSARGHWMLSSAK